MTPTCKFCGQAVIVELPEGCTPLEAEEIATENCSCLLARENKKKLKAKEQAKAQVEELFGKCSSEDTVELMKDAVELLHSSDIERLTMNINSTTVAEVKIDAKGKYSVTKTLTVKAKRESE